MPLALELSEPSVVAIWNPRMRSVANSKGAGRGWSAMVAKTQPLADAVLRACLDFWAANDPAFGERVAEQTWTAGCRDPTSPRPTLASSPRADGWPTCVPR